MDTKNELADIRRDPRTFPWGTLRKLHDVGHRYTIAEYIVSDASHSTRFHVYVDGESTSQSADTFDGALIVAIAQSHDVRDAAFYAARLLKVIP